MNLTHNMRQALIDLDNPLCTASVYWSKNTMNALHSRGFVDKRDNGITRSWELRPEGKAWLAASGTSGCATCDDLRAENAALRERVEALEKTNLRLEETAKVLAEQVGKGNLGKIQDALNYAHYKATEREAMK